MLALDLQERIELSFLELRTIPRVLFYLVGEYEGVRYEGVGEASIDFPFVSYDLWDVFHCLSQLSVRDLPYPDGWELTSAGFPLPPIPFRREQLEFVGRYPSALAALTAASDDLWGRAHRQSLTKMTNALPQGLTSWSIGFCDSLADLHKRIYNAWQHEAIPKIKLGRSLQQDIELCQGLDELDFTHPSRREKLSADFNGAYTMQELLTLLSNIDQKILSNFLFIEQPLKKVESWSRYVELPRYLKTDLHWHGHLVADESVITHQDAVELAKIGWHINYKMQKIGGLRRGLGIESRTNKAVGMVGGTLPTAIGRAYDLWAGGSLSSCSLPSDAWMPSTEWFTGGSHIILEEYSIDALGRALPFEGSGIGITPNWEKIDRATVPDPKVAYRAIRSNKTSSFIDFKLRNQQSYYELYKILTGKDPLWNL
jgi:L-alanine-DL-glutamate epimerase-like enolase superfamily enzyme